MARQHHRYPEGSKRYSLNIERTSSATDAATLFQDALKKMDGVIGIGSSEATTFGYASSLGDQASRLSEQLRAVATSPHQNGTVSQPDPRLSVHPETRDFLINWLSRDPRGCPHGSQLQRDRNTLVQQLQQMEEQLELLRSEREALKSSITDLQKKGDHEHSQTGSFSSGSVGQTVTANQTDIKKDPSGAKNISAPGLQRSGSIKRNSTTRRSYRESISKKFGRKKSNGKDLQRDNEDGASTRNPRTVRFFALNGSGLTEWMGDIGLEMYGEIVSQLVGTGERLASICGSTEDLMRLGVSNVLHCKKLQLAVEDEMAEIPSPLAPLDHHWVSDWLSDVGLAQYQEIFMDARVDARMLNAITMDELAHLNVTHPFHLTSLHRAIQAFRACSYDGNYMKIKPEKGSHKLVQWSAHHLMDWLREIELDEYADRLQGTGVSGPVIALESNFNHDSLSKAIGIHPPKWFLLRYLRENFVSLVGPVCFQNKADAMEKKHFIPIDPTEQPKKQKSSSKKKSDKGADYLLCPLTDLPTITVVRRPVTRGAATVPGCHSRSASGGLSELGTSTGQWRSTTISPPPPQPSQQQPVPPPPPLGQLQGVSHAHSLGQLQAAPPPPPLGQLQAAPPPPPLGQMQSAPPLPPVSVQTPLLQQQYPHLRHPSDLTTFTAPVPPRSVAALSLTRRGSAPVAPPPPPPPPILTH